MNQFISLLSSGLDSPIAAYFMMKKGYSPIFLSFLTSDDEKNSMKEKIVRVIKHLKKLTKSKIKVYFINHDNNLNIFKENCERKLTCILCKRLMLRIAQEIGKKEATNLIVTGDILGEQASQTLDNLYSYNSILENSLIIRPLIGRNKLEIIRWNQDIGLYRITSKSSSGCQFNPQYPETHAKVEEILSSEKKINVLQLLKNSLERVEILNF
ncbi:MAG: hypothetical protein ACTSR8_17435 [Promethearchaeota archaeon]